MNPENQIINDVVTSKSVNLINCDREQIHIPSAIQPHGVLIVLEKDSFNIVQFSDNADDFLKINSAEFIDTSITTLIDDTQTQVIKSCLDKDFAAINPLRIKINDLIYNGIVHDNGEHIILELEVFAVNPVAGFFGFYQMARGIVNKIHKTSDLSELSKMIVKSIRNLTKFDRVMVYRFDKDESGHIIAEDKRDDLESFLGLHYPYTDVPQPARRLYKLNFIRAIPDVDYEEVNLGNHPTTNKPFDLSFSVLRSVSPIHVKYLQNMGVKSSMSISLLSNDKLWGLIACHNYEKPKYISYEIRTVCEFLGQIMSLELVTKEEKENLDYKIKSKAVLANLIQSLSKSRDLIEGLIKNSDRLQKIVNSSGIAICDSEDIYLMGKTPTENQVKDLIKWINRQFENDIYSTDRLPKIYPPSQNFKDVASGVLALCLNKLTNSYMLWFRPEVIQTVNWAGNPHKKGVIDEDGIINLSPRESFNKWKESISNQSLPWQKYEIHQLMELKIIIVEVIFKKAVELAELNIELQRSNEELDSFAYVASHDLKEPLRGIFNYSQFLLEDYESILDEDGVYKLNTLMVLSRRMESLIEGLLHYSRIGRRELESTKIKVEDIIKQIKVILEASLPEKIDIRITRPLPPIMGDSVLIEELFTNLITNAYKYNNSDSKCVEIGYLENQNKKKSNNSIPKVTFYVRDNGIGIRDKHKHLVFRIFKRLHVQSKYGGGTGAGLTIVKRIIERHQGEIWLDSKFGEGTTFYFTLPAITNV